MEPALLKRKFSYNLRFKDTIFPVTLRFNKFKLHVDPHIDLPFDTDVTYMGIYNSKDVETVLKLLDIPFNNFKSKRLDIVNQFEGYVNHPNKLISNETLVLGCKNFKDTKVYNKLTVYNIVNREHDILISLIERQLYLNSVGKKLSRTRILAFYTVGNLFESIIYQALSRR